MGRASQPPTQSVPVYDVAQYVCTPGRAYILTGIGFEVCQVQAEPTGYIYQVKNENAETLWYDSNYVYRGLDTSPNPTEVYAQFTGNTYGAPWAKRFMTINEAFRRRPTIRWYTRGGTPIPDRTATVTDWFRLIAHYPTFLSPAGATVQDVLEFHWLPDANGNPGTTILERYYYARGIGLVGFGGDMGRSSISPVTPAQPPNRERLSWFNEPVPPPRQPVTQPNEFFTPPSPALVNGVITQMPGTFVNVRSSPEVIEGNQITQAQRNATVKFRDAGTDWYEVEIMIPVRGFVSKQNGRVVITPQ
jgi:hypothetical protein